MTTLIGSIILAGGALLGIWLGAYYAAGRLGAQLQEQAKWLGERREIESQQFAEQLAAESARLERQLEHDRRMRDREELRKVLDEVMGKITLAIHAILEARNRVPVLGNREEGYQESAKEEADRYQAYGTAREKVYELIFEVQRLRLRFGLEHAITKGYLKAQQGLEDLLSEVTVDKDQWTVAQREVLEKKVEDCGKQNKDLAEACRKYTDVEIAR